VAEEYEIGYGKPPLHTRFRTGYSGHPEGRPKGATNVKAEMKRLLAAKTAIKVGGTVQKVPTSTAMCLAVIQKALKGDVRAFSKIVEMVGPEMADELRAAASVSSTDLDLLRRALSRGEEETNGAQVPAEPPSEGEVS
jgi:Family of unknown function (DUF5681)